MNEYKKYLKSKNLAPSTIKNYLWHIDKFLNWLDNKQIDNDHLNKYFNYLLKKYKKVNTINLRLKIINNYLKFINKKIQLNLLSDEKPTLKILNKEQLAIFLKNPLKNKGPVALRDKALLELLYSSGLKVGQIVNLKISQIDQIKKSILLSKNNIITLKPGSWFYLNKYLEMRRDNSDYLFINFDRANKSANRALSVRSVERLINNYNKNINPPVNINPQILRNTLAYNLKSQGAQSEHIKKSLNFRTTIGAKNYFNQI